MEKFIASAKLFFQNLEAWWNRRKLFWDNSYPKLLRGTNQFNLKGFSKNEISLRYWDGEYPIPPSQSTHIVIVPQANGKYKLEYWLLQTFEGTVFSSGGASGDKSRHTCEILVAWYKVHFNKFEHLPWATEYMHNKPGTAWRVE